MSFEERQAKKEKLRKESEKKHKGKLRKRSGQKYLFPTGIYSLDRSLNGGLPRGRIIEIYGGESSGKTTNASIIASSVNTINYSTGEIDFTYEDPSSVWIGDMEDTYDPIWGRKLGFDSEKYGNDVDYVLGGDTLCDTVVDHINDDSYSLYIVDCTDQCYPSEVLEGEYAINDLGLRSRALARCMRKWQTALAKSYKRNEDTPWKIPSIILLSHGKPIFMDKFGRWESDAGKNIRFYCSVRIYLSQNKISKEGTADFGKGKMTALVKKNKVTGAAGMVSEYFIQLADGDNEAGYLDNVKPIFKDMDDFGIMKRLSQSKVSVNGVEYKNQKELKTKMYDDPDFLAEMWQQCTDYVASGGVEFEIDENQIDED